MTRSQALWKLFEATGSIGAYLIYKQYEALEDGYDSTLAPVQAGSSLAVAVPVQE